MQIVIKIPEKLYEECKRLGDKNDTLFEAIRRGTQLPKGHGRLIDADELSKKLINASLYYRGETADMFDTRFSDGLKEADIKLTDTPTIVEADKGEEQCN